VRHVVRTQSTDDAPDPDVEGWLAAGRPDHDEHLAICWDADAGARVLRNRTFIGELPHRGGWVPGAHDALLDLEVFDAAQALADKRTSQTTPRRSAGDFALTGTVFCGHCAAAYIGNSGLSANKTKVRYYSCVTSRRYGKATCPAPSVNADDLQRLVGDALVSTYADTDLFAGAVAAHVAQRGERVAPLEGELASARAPIAAKDGCSTSTAATTRPTGSTPTSTAPAPVSCASTSSRQRRSPTRLMLQLAEAETTPRRGPPSAARGPGRAHPHRAHRDTQGAVHRARGASRGPRLPRRATDLPARRA
jgi:hypothetical protein